MNNTDRVIRLENKWMCYNCPFRGKIEEVLDNGEMTRAVRCKRLACDNHTTSAATPEPVTLHEGIEKYIRAQQS